MGMIDSVKVKARQCVKRIVLPEGDEPRTVQAAVKIRNEKIACPILLGDPQAIKNVAAEKVSMSQALKLSIRRTARRRRNTRTPSMNCAKPRA